MLIDYGIPSVFLITFYDMPRNFLSSDLLCLLLLYVNSYGHVKTVTSDFGGLLPDIE